MDRREFVTALAALTAASTAHGEQRPEVENAWADVPPGATLWGLAVFLSDEPIEFTVGTGGSPETIRGRFGGQRLAEYSWRNESDSAQRVAVRAKALASERELPSLRVQYLSEQHVSVAFGRRAIPERPADRRGSYPHEAVFIGFITFEP